jgi:hypothetical protein
MPRLEADFFDYEPKKFMTLDLTLYTEEALREMSYFLWSMYPEESELMEWRRTKLIPLIQIDNLEFLEGDED